VHTTSDTPAAARPRIVVLCGFTRFWEQLAEANLYETAAGSIVLAPGCNMKEPHPLWQDPARAERLKNQLDYLHYRHSLRRHGRFCHQASLPIRRSTVDRALAHFRW
jgi:hypothetical protein